MGSHSPNETGELEVSIQEDDYHIFPTISYYDRISEKNRLFRLSDYTFETVDMLFGKSLSSSLSAGMSVLDIACGWKHSPLNAIAEMGIEAYGMDIAVDNLDSGSLHLRKMDARKISELGIFDLIYSHQFLYHMFRPVEAIDYLRGACTHIAQGGTGLFDHHHLALMLRDDPAAAAKAIGVRNLEVLVGKYEEMKVTKHVFYIKVEK